LASCTHREAGGVGVAVGAGVAVGGALPPAVFTAKPGLSTR